MSKFRKKSSLCLNKLHCYDTCILNYCTLKSWLLQTIDQQTTAILYVYMYICTYLYVYMYICIHNLSELRPPKYPQICDRIFYVFSCWPECTFYTMNTLGCSINTHSITLDQIDERHTPANEATSGNSDWFILIWWHRRHSHWQIF